MSFAEELKSFKQTHRYSELVIGGIKTSYLLCGNSESERVRECNKAIHEE